MPMLNSIAFFTEAGDVFAVLQLFGQPSMIRLPKQFSILHCQIR